MANNDVILLEDMLRRDRASYETGASDSDHEAYFVSKQYLRHYSPTHDDLVSGLVDGAHDGGIDAIYPFVNSLCIRDDLPVAGLGRAATLDLFLFQVKNSRGFGEAAIDKLIINLPKLLDFERNEESLRPIFNDRVLEVSRRFLFAYRALELPDLRIFVAFASLRAEYLHENTARKAADLECAIRACFGSASIRVDFLDAVAIADLARQRPSTARSLALAENPISTATAGGYVAVVRIEDYERFITDSSGKLDASLFDANVRDYEGETIVNESIQETLSHPEKELDFWWLNNGVTIIARSIQPAGKLLQLDDAQVVNGLQTSTEIFKRGRLAGGEREVRNLLVKVIQAQDDTIRDRIIRATNSQTSLSSSALRATDKVQRQIEEYLAVNGLHYERRRRQYLNQGKHIDSLVSVDQMGQAVLSIMVQSPHIARGEVGRIFDDDIYDLLFASSHPVQMYVASIKILRAAREHLTLERHTRAQSEDFVYHLSMLTAIAMTRKHCPTSDDLCAVENAEIEPNLLAAMLKLLQDEFFRVARFRGDTVLDGIAKDESVTAGVLELSRRYLGRSRRR